MKFKSTKAQPSKLLTNLNLNLNLVIKLKMKIKLKLSKTKLGFDQIEIKACFMINWDIKFLDKLKSLKNHLRGIQ